MGAKSDGKTLGTLVTVDLTAERVSGSGLPPELVRRFLGGRGLNAWLLARHLKPGIDALGPENALALSCGLLAGLGMPGASRLHLSGLSPLSGRVGQASLGSALGSAMHATGVQSLLVQGRARRPVTLWIDEGRVELRDAARLWGMGAREAGAALDDELGSATHKIVIGPAGENRVRFAGVATGTRHAAGRSGLGAVLGAKRLKAIVVRGGQQPEGHRDPSDALMDMCEGCIWHCETPGGAERGNGHNSSWAARLGDVCGLTNPQLVAELFDLTGDLGMDVGATAEVLALAAGPVRDPDGGWQSWEAASAAEKLRQIAGRQGLGDVLAEGPVRAARLLGLHAKAKPDVRTGQVSGDPPEASAIVMAVLDSLGICRTAPVTTLAEQHLGNADVISAALAAWNIGEVELAVAGEQIVRLEKQLGAIEGKAGSV